MNPVFKGVEVAHSLGMVSVAVDQLGEHVASLADKGQVIADALGELLVQSWGRSFRETPAGAFRGLNQSLAERIPPRAAMK